MACTGLGFHLEQCKALWDDGIRGLEQAQWEEGCVTEGFWILYPVEVCDRDYLKYLEKHVLGDLHILCCSPATL